MNKNKKFISDLKQNLPKNVQGPHVIGGDNGSNIADKVMVAYNLYQERESQYWVNKFKGVFE